MKKSVSMFVALIFAIGFALTASAQIRIVTYPSGTLSKKIPTFQNAIIAINYNGTVADRTKKIFMEKGSARTFAESPDTAKENPCGIPMSVVCVSVKIDNNGSAGGYGGFGGNTRRGSYMTQSSFNGNMYTVTVNVVAIERDSHGRVINRVELGSASKPVAVGSSSEWSSSSGPNNSGYLNFGGMSSLDQVVPNAVADDVNRLFSPGLAHCFVDIFSSACNAYVIWYPGAADEVSRIFQPIEAPIPTSGTPEIALTPDRQ